MFNIKIITISKSSDRNILESINNYSKKMSSQFNISSINIKPEKKYDSIDKKKKIEAEKIASHISGSFVVALDEKGKLYDSKEFAYKISWWKQNFSCLTFIIGGADGLDNSMLDKADAILSFSKMTFPHQLIKLFLYEQLYRSSAILTNHPYHRE
mgnify:CR=1 FL=1